MFPPLPSPLEEGPLNEIGGLGRAISASSGVRGRAPAENEFGANLVMSCLVYRVTVYNGCGLSAVFCIINQ